MASSNRTLAPRQRKPRQTVGERDAARLLELPLSSFRALRIPCNKRGRWEIAGLVRVYNAAVMSPPWTDVVDDVTEQAVNAAQRRRPEWREALRASIRAVEPARTV